MTPIFQPTYGGAGPLCTGVYSMLNVSPNNTGINPFVVRWYGTNPGGYVIFLDCGDKRLNIFWNENRDTVYVRTKTGFLKEVFNYDVNDGFDKVFIFHGYDIKKPSDCILSLMEDFCDEN